MICFISSNPIFIDPASQIIFFSVDISAITYFFIKCVKKAKFLKIAKKWDRICQKT